MGRIWDLEKYSNKTALHDENGKTMTYGVLNEEAEKLAEKIGHRCLVFLLCRNEMGSVLGYTAFVNNGIVPVMVNSHLEELLLENLLKTYSPEYLWVPKDQAESFAGMSKVYEAYDYDDKEIVKSFFSHHQGMILASLCNYLRSDAIKNYFHKETIF